MLLLVPTAVHGQHRERLMYEYGATLVRVVDGDTVEMSVDLGMRLYHRQTMRLRGINTPELNSKDQSERERAVEAKAFLANWLGGKKLVIRTHKDTGDKYGRLLVDIYDGGVCVNQMLIDEGLAVPYDGGSREPA